MPRHTGVLRMHDQVIKGAGDLACVKLLQERSLA